MRFSPVYYIPAKAPVEKLLLLFSYALMFLLISFPSLIHIWCLGNRSTRTDIVCAMLNLLQVPVPRKSESPG